MICKICQNNSLEIFKETVLNKYQVSYFQCPNCDFIQTEEPYWLSESYSSAINISDTGLVARNISFSRKIINIIYYLFDYKKIFLDYAGGHGLFVRLMRDAGLEFKWQDNFSQNFLARSFEYTDVDKNIELVTAMEVFEHFSNPIEEIEKILKISSNILFSTEIFSGLAPKPELWNYYGFKHGQHIAFYSSKSLKIIAEKYKLNYHTDGRYLHLLTNKKINKVIFKLLINRKLSFLFCLWAKLHLNSKTLSDQMNISKN